MARAMVLLQACQVLLVVSTTAAATGLGVNWGNIASDPLDPGIVVGMLKDNGIKRVKLFDSDHWTVNSLAGTSIQVMIAIPNDQLDSLTDYGNAKDWVKKNVTVHIHDGGVDIRYVAVGNEPFLTSYNGSFIETTLPALKNVQKALEEHGLGDRIKAVVPHNADVYQSPSNVPSQGEFRPDIKDLMTNMVKFLKEKNAPFVVNIYPFLSLYQNPDFPTEFAFFDGAQSPIDDNGKTYTNVFDANFDTLVWTLKKAGAGDLKIIVGEIGWPTDADKNANIDLARKFYDGLLKKLGANKGTPMRPGSMEVYLFGLVDENMKSIAPGNFERHWGIFRYDGQPKFPMDLSGKGNDKMPIAAKGVRYMDPQWCVYDGTGNQDEIGADMDYACSRADCTPLVSGGSCSDLDNKGHISYAFNIYFQMNQQSVEACQFSGSAKIVKHNASTATCLFPIEVLSAAPGRVSLGSRVTAWVALAWVLIVLNNIP